MGVFSKNNKANALAYKTSINFVGINETEENWVIAIPLTVAIIVVAVLLSKFAVIDRYSKLWAKEAEVSALENEFAEGMAKIEDSSEMSEKFYHYTWSLLSEEEQNRISRVDVASLITYIGSQGHAINSYTISGDQITVNITAPSLESISRLAMNLEDRDIVESTSVQTAQTDSEGVNAQSGVQAQIIIYIAEEQAEEE